MNTGISNILKLLAQGTTGVGTGIAGSVPAGVSLLASGGQWLSNKLNPEDVESRDFLEKIKSAAEYATPEALQGYLGKVTGGYLQPSTEPQKVATEVGQDIGGILGGGGTIRKAAKIAGLGNIAKQGAKGFGLSDQVAELFKLGGMASSGIFKTSKGIEKVKKPLYNIANEAVLTKKMASAASIVPAAEKVLKEAYKGLDKSVPYKRTAIDIAEKMINKVHGNEIVASDLWSSKKDMYDVLKKGSDFEKLHELMQPLTDATYRSLDAYGRLNPLFGYAFKNADTLHAIENGLPLVDKAIDKVIGQKDKTGMGEFIRKSLVYSQAGLKGLMTKSVLTSLGRRGEALMYSPAYRKESINLAKATAKSSAPAVINSVKKLVKIKEQYDNRLTNKQGNTFKFVGSNKIQQKKVQSISTNGLNPGFKFLTKQEAVARKQQANQ
jgi:hypothetical protein